MCDILCIIHDFSHVAEKESKKIQYTLPSVNAPFGINVTFDCAPAGVHVFNGHTQLKCSTTQFGGHVTNTCDKIAN